MFFHKNIQTEKKENIKKQAAEEYLESSCFPTTLLFKLSCALEIFKYF